MQRSSAWEDQDTIAALATPPGKGALGIIRLSGAHAIAIAQRLLPKIDLANVPSHTVRRVKIYDPEYDSILDDAIVTVFHAPRSYTRENVVELTMHGSPYLLQRALALLTLGGARIAKPGEFTQRAFLNGALSLSQAEAVADLIAAESRAAAQIAHQQLKGTFWQALVDLRDKLLHFAALIELELDFVEEDVAFAQRDVLANILNEGLQELTRLIKSFSVGNALKNGIPTVIAGRPNAGKSTLLNRLLEENRAIVSAIPGTTRDVIEAQFFVGGFGFRLADTAGLRNTTDEIEAEGVRRSLQKVGQAALVIYVLDATSDLETERTYRDSIIPQQTTCLTVVNKQDLSPSLDLKAGEIAICAASGDGIETLRTALESYGQTLTSEAGGTIVSNARHVQTLKLCHEALLSVKNALVSGVSGEFLALDLRLALDHIGNLTGEGISQEAILSDIFSNFCIGK